MRTKRPELTAGLVAVKGGAGAADMSTRADGPVSTPTMAQAKQAGQGREDLVPLNFRLPASFRREFKTYAASHDMKLNELLRLCFDTYRRGKGD